MQKINRLNPASCEVEEQNRSSIDSLIWHIILHNTISHQDKLYLESLAFEHCETFILKDMHLLYQSERLNIEYATLKESINSSCDATYQQKISCNKNGSHNIITVPLATNLLIGLVMPEGLGSFTSLEDRFLHKAHQLQEKFVRAVESLDSLNQITQGKNPILLINRSDDQFIGWNDLALSFFNLSPQEILESNLQSLQKNSPKASKRKIQIDNKSIGDTECSIVQYTLTKSDTNPIVDTTLELQTHATFLMQQYQELLSGNVSKSDFIESRIVDIGRCFQELQQLQINEKNKQQYNNTGHPDAISC